MHVQRDIFSITDSYLRPPPIWYPCPDLCSLSLKYEQLFIEPKRRT